MRRKIALDKGFLLVQVPRRSVETRRSAEGLKENFPFWDSTMLVTSAVFQSPTGIHPFHKSTGRMRSSRVNHGSEDSLSAHRATDNRQKFDLTRKSRASSNLPKREVLLQSLGSLSGFNGFTREFQQKKTLVSGHLFAQERTQLLRQTGRKL